MRLLLISLRERASYGQSRVYPRAFAIGMVRIFEHTECDLSLSTAPEFIAAEIVENLEAVLE